MPGDDSPEKLIYPLDHAYTPAELADCELHLALVTVEESGIAEHTPYFGSRRGRWLGESADEFAVDEVCDRRLRLSEWREPGGDKCR